MQVSNSVVNGVHGAPSCSNTKSLFEIRWIAGSKPCSSTFWVINMVYSRTWLHKHKVHLTRFWNSDRNHRPNALREMFSSLQHSLGRHSPFDLTCWISSGLTRYVRDRSCFTVFRITRTIANRLHVSCAHNTLRASIGTGVTLTSFSGCTSFHFVSFFILITL